MTKRVIALLVAAAATIFVPETAHAAVPGLVHRSVVSAADSVSPKTIAIECPTGAQVIGSGVYLDWLGDAIGKVVVDDLIVAATYVQVTGYEVQSGTDGTWWIRAFAICANPLPGYEIITVNSAFNSVTPKSATATCTAGKRAIGAGGLVYGGVGQVAMTTMQPNTSSATVVGAEDADGTASNWFVRSYAICANPLAGLEIVSLKSATDSNNKWLSPVCSAGKKVLSLGWEIVAAEPGRVAADISYANGETTVISGREIGPNVASNWTLGARIICATP